MPQGQKATETPQSNLGHLLELDLTTLGAVNKERGQGAVRQWGAPHDKDPACLSVKKLAASTPARFCPYKDVGKRCEAGVHL